MILLLTIQVVSINGIKDKRRKACPQKMSFLNMPTRISETHFRTKWTKKIYRAKANEH